MWKWERRTTMDIYAWEIKEREREGGRECEYVCKWERCVCDSEREREVQNLQINSQIVSQCFCIE